MRVFFGAVRIKGNKPGSLEYIDSDLLSHRDVALVLEDDKMYFYWLDQYSGEKEDIPYVVKPRDIKSDYPLISRMKRGKLISQKYLTNSLIQTTENFLQTANIKYESENLEFIVTEFEDYNQPMNIVFHEDGKVVFPYRVNGIDPEENDHLTTKRYVDLQLSIWDDDIKEYLQNSIDDYLDKPGEELKEYLHNERPQLKERLKLYFNDDEDEIYEEINRLYNKLYGIYDDIKEYLHNQIREVKNIKTGSYDDEFVTHNLYTGNLLVDVYDDGDKLVPATIDHFDNETLKVYPFSNKVTITRGDPYNHGEVDHYGGDNRKIYPNSNIVYSDVISHKPERTIEQQEEKETGEVFHKLYNKHIIAMVYDDQGNKIYPAYIQLIDDGNCEIIFNKPVSGYVVLIESQYWIGYDFDEKANDLDNLVEDYISSEIDKLGTEVENQIEDSKEDLKSYIDYKIEEFEDDFKKVKDYERKTWHITEGNYDGLYFIDINTDIEHDSFFITVYSEGKIIYPVKIEKINTSKIRIWMEEEKDIIVSIFYMVEPIEDIIT